MCRHFVAACNFLVLNRPSSPPAALPPLNDHQRDMLCRYERWAATWLRLSRGLKSGLGRSVQKLQTISDQISVLQQMSQRLFSELQPYSKASRGPAEDVPIRAEPAPSEPLVPSKVAPTATNMSIEPSRLTFEEAPKFNARRFLCDPLLRAGLQDPRAFRAPSCQWVKPKLTRVHCSRQKQLELFKKWDLVHSLHLIPASSSEFRYRCGLFSVFKNDTTDRQILNPIPENSRCFSVSDATHTLAHSSLLCQLYIPEGSALVINSDDLCDFYHGFLVSDQHAARNHLHGVFKAEEFEGWNCHREELRGQDVVGCFRTLAMGTSYAVEVAQHSHSVLLYRSGCLREKERVSYRCIFPKGPGFDLLCIDDHVYLLLVKLSEVNKPPSPNRRDVRLLSRASYAYLKSGLRVSAKKKVRNATQATVLGGDLDGVRGDICAPRLRTTALGGLTLQLILLGYCSKDLLQCLIGSWVFVCMFRRGFMCLLTAVYHEMRNRAGGEIFRLSHDARQELLLLVLLSPCMFTDLRAAPLDHIYCTDASGFAAGACHSRISRSASLELLRHADHKGYHTSLLPRSSELASRFGDHADDDYFSLGLPQQLTEGILFDFLEIFRGEGNLSSVAGSLGLRVHPGFDPSTGSSGDFASSDCFDQVLGLICRRVVGYVHVKPPCDSFGTMWKPRLRDKSHPWGFDPHDVPTQRGNRIAMRTAFVLNLSSAYGILASADQPLGSTMFKLDIFRRLVKGRFHSFELCKCTYGSPFEGRSVWLVNNPVLLQLRAKCACALRKRHLRLSNFFTEAGVKEFVSLCQPSPSAVFGRDPREGEPVSMFSRMYPLALCRRIFELQLPSLRLLQQPDVDTSRPASTPPRWIADLGNCLPWKKLYQYRFSRVNHININEELSYRTLIKYLAKHSPNSRCGILLDSRVVIGCNSKGRSSSAKLNYYLSTSLPYIIGGNIYPYHFHVGTHDNCADDPSRLQPLRSPADHPPLWLRRFLAGDDRYLAAVRLADDRVGPCGGWARLVCVLSLLRADASPPPGFEQ